MPILLILAGAALGLGGLAVSRAARQVHNATDIPAQLPAPVPAPAIDPSMFGGAGGVPQGGYAGASPMAASAAMAAPVAGTSIPTGGGAPKSASTGNPGYPDSPSPGDRGVLNLDVNPNINYGAGSFQTDPTRNGPGYTVNTDYYAPFVNAGVNPSASYSGNQALTPEQWQALGYTQGVSAYNPSAGPQWFGPLVAKQGYTPVTHK